jgi:hypothetical protein
MSFSADCEARTLIQNPVSAAREARALQSPPKLGEERKSQTQGLKPEFIAKAFTYGLKAVPFSKISFSAACKVVPDRKQSFSAACKACALQSPPE